jgi:glycosyltransferase involved in cell wall biosynthesis
MNPVLCRLACEITAISDATREALVRFENIPHDAIRVVYNGIDDKGFLSAGDPSMKSALGIPQDAFVLGAVARLDAIKNHALMIKSLKRVRSLYSNACLVIIGDGSERSSLEHLADELELRDHVFFTGYREDAAAFYQIMDIFLLTSFSEGTAMTLLEAMASAIPCIATNVGGNHEVVSNGNTGFIVPSGDEASLTDAVCSLLGDKNLRQKMARAGRRRFEENFTVSRMVEEYQTIYDRAVREDASLSQRSRRN